MVDAVTIGRVIQGYREKKKLSQEVVSGLADIGRTHLRAKDARPCLSRARTAPWERIPCLQVSLRKIAQNKDRGMKQCNHEEISLCDALSPIAGDGALDVPLGMTSIIIGHAPVQSLPVLPALPR